MFYKDLSVSVDICHCWYEKSLNMANISINMPILTNTITQKYLFSYNRLKVNSENKFTLDTHINIYSSCIN